MKKILFTLCLLFSILNILNAQVGCIAAFNFVDSTSQPGLKKYGTKIIPYGIDVPLIFVTQSVDGSLDSTIFFGDSLPNLANSAMSDADLNNAYYITQVFNTNNTNELLAAIVYMPHAKNLLRFVPTIMQAVQPPNGLNCDGTINLLADTAGCVFNSSSLMVGGQNIDQNGVMGNVQFFDSICGGRLDISYAYSLTSVGSSSNAVTAQESASLLLGPYAFPSASNLNVVVDPYNGANSPTCDGKARVSISNTVVPFSCAFDGGSFTSSDSIINLCEGMHSVLIATATDTIGKYFIIPDIGNTTSNVNPYSPPIDTIVYNFTNCNFDYNLPIDSAFLVNYSVIDTNTIYFSWQIWQGGIVTAVSDTISYSYQTGTSMVSLLIFCGNARTTSTANFKTFRINDYVNLVQTAGIKDQDKKKDFSVYPNPFSNGFTITADRSSKIKNIEVFNLLGEKMGADFEITEDKTTVNTTNLIEGYYTIAITSKSDKKSYIKVLKQ